MKWVEGGNGEYSLTKEMGKYMGHCPLGLKWFLY